MIGIVGVGMTNVIVAGEIDLSVGSVAALAGVGAAYLSAKAGLPSALAISTVLLMGAGCGCLIGALRTGC